METTNKQEKTNEQETTNNKPNKCEVLGAVIAFGAIGFWFGIGAILAVKMVKSLEYCIEKLISRK